MTDYKHPLQGCEFDGLISDTAKVSEITGNAISETDLKEVLTALNRPASAYFYDGGVNLFLEKRHLEIIRATIRAALSAPAVPVIDGLDEAIKNLSDCKNASWVELNGKDVNDLMKLLKAARAYAELQKGA